MLSYAQARTRLATVVALGLAATTIAVTAPAAWAVDDVAPRLDSITFTSPADVQPGDPLTVNECLSWSAEAVEQSGSHITHPGPYSERLPDASVSVTRYR